MAYTAPYIDSAGLHYPSYQDILEDLITSARSIYGSDIYLGSDSQDYELLSILALKIFDTFQALEIAYNAHSPATAIGTGLDYIVAINGLKRKAATRSTCTVTLSGTAGTVITSGVCADTSGNLWNLPDSVTIGATGSVSVTATAAEAGNLQADAGTITRIMTPTLGWTSVNNTQAATIGKAVEQDSELRERQQTSVALASKTVLGGLKGAILGLDDVERCSIVENATASASSEGIPAHSICCVVEGGTDADIGSAILYHKTAGCGTYGSTSVTVEDEYGISNTVSFQRPTQVEIDVTVNVTRRSGYSASYASAITLAIVNYINSFDIGADLAVSMLQMLAQQINPDSLNPAFSVTSVTAARHGSTQSTSDVVLAYNEVAHGSVNNITVTVT